MFIERELNSGKRAGSIEVICGSMFSGKTEELIRRIKRAKIARQKVEIFKPAIDVRYSTLEVVSHDENAIRSTPVENSSNILLLAADVDVVGIDEAQFFDRHLIEVAVQLANQGIRVIASRTRYGFQGKPFWAYSRIDGCCRLHYQGSCCLCKVRYHSSIFASSDRKRAGGTSGRKRHL
jgi:thymidine kinase